MIRAQANKTDDCSFAVQGAVLSPAVAPQEPPLLLEPAHCDWWCFRLARPGTCCLVGGRLLVFCSHLARTPHYVRRPLFICTIFMVSTRVILRFGRYEGIFYKARLVASRPQMKFLELGLDLRCKGPGAPVGRGNRVNIKDRIPCLIPTRELRTHSMGQGKLRPWPSQKGRPPTRRLTNTEIFFLQQPAKTQK